MRTLIAVASYHGDAERGSHRAIRDTWGKDAIALGADLRFMIGRRIYGWAPKEPDEILLDESRLQVGAKDEIYWQNLYREIYRWSLEQQYDFMFICCNDTFIVPRKLMASGFENYDASGIFVPGFVPLAKKSIVDIYGHKLYSWPDAGVGWWMSRKALQICVNDIPSEWTCDIHTGQVLGAKAEVGEVTLGELKGFWNSASWHYRWNHANQAYNPATGWQQQMYERHGSDR